MADRERLADFLNIPVSKVPQIPDQILDPKQYLVNLARSSRNKTIREEICPPPRATNMVGPAYNDRIGLYLAEYWRPEVAMQASNSLMRADQRIRELIERP
jgi:hypothetical protein